MYLNSKLDHSTSSSDSLDKWVIRREMSARSSTT